MARAYLVAVVRAVNWRPRGPYYLGWRITPVIFVDVRGEHLRHCAVVNAVAQIVTDQRRIGPPAVADYNAATSPGRGRSPNREMGRERLASLVCQTPPVQGGSLLDCYAGSRIPGGAYRLTKSLND